MRTDCEGKDAMAYCRSFGPDRKTEPTPDRAASRYLRQKPRPPRQLEYGSGGALVICHCHVAVGRPFFRRPPGVRTTEATSPEISSTAAFYVSDGGNCSGISQVQHCSFECEKDFLEAFEEKCSSVGWSQSSIYY